MGKNNKTAESAINKRIKKIIEELNMSDRAFSKAIGIPQTTLSNIFNRDTEPNGKILSSIINNFGFIDSHWLLTGEGEMKRHNNGSGGNISGISGNNLSVGGNISGVSGNFGSIINGSTDKSISISLPKSGYQKIINENGDERTIEINSIGDNVAIKEIENLRELVLAQKEIISLQKNKIAELESLLRNNM